MSKALDVANAARRKRVEAGLKATLNPIEKLARKPMSLRMAINAKCYDCEGQDADPAWAWRIGNCEIRECPLWAVRPFQDRANTPMPLVLQDPDRDDR